MRASHLKPPTVIHRHRARSGGATTAESTVESGTKHNRPSTVEYSFWLFLAVAVGRINQVIPHLSSLPLAKLAVAVTAIAYLAQRRTLPNLSGDGRRLMRTGLFMAGLAILLTPFSIYKSASLHFVLFGLPPLIVGTAIACSMRRSWNSLRGTLLVLLLCGFVLSALAALEHAHGRADVKSTMYDPNDLAYVLVTVFPFGLGFITLAQSRLWKILYGFITAVTVAALLLTQSRGGLLGLVTVLILLTFLPLGVPAPGKPLKHVRSLRAALAVGIVVLSIGAVVWSQLPTSAQARYLTLLHSNEDYNANVNIKNGRLGIWSEGLRAFAAWPLGYGPLTFPFVDSRFGGYYRAPHNSYLEALVELGPLGLYFLIRVYFLSLRALHQTRHAALARPKRTRESLERAVLSRALLYGVAGNMVSGFFLTDAYSMLAWCVFGLTAAISATTTESTPQSTPSRRKSTHHC